ncbi:TRAP transporter large permease subunit [Paenalcaligenes niemegkensis]|nr:TRAP transporter large permease subunit [Paenalcaligenes niemegkensis]MCQ9615711.1 TRAP transporter large permease subunit [Paenalcaligenes niemegkensis]
MEQQIVGLLFGGFIILLLIGAPITVSLAGAAMAAFLVLGKNPISFVQIAFTSVGSFPLMALPAFILAGALMEAAGISRRLVDIAESLAGPITGEWVQRRFWLACFLAQYQVLVQRQRRRSEC